MTPLLWIGALANDALAEAAIEFKTTGPVTIYVDGRPAARLSDVRQRVGGLEDGLHSIEVRGRYGPAYKADIDLPNDTITYASWDGRQLQVLRTAWLDEEAVSAPLAPAPPAAEPVAAEPVAAEPEEPLPPAQETVDIEVPVTPVPEEIDEVAVVVEPAPAPVAPAPPPRRSPRWRRSPRRRGSRSPCRRRTA